MTVKDFLSVLIYDAKTCISIQTKDQNGMIIEVGNDNQIFSHSIETYHDNVIEYIKIEKKTIYIII